MTGLFAVLGAIIGMGIAGFAGMVGGGLTGFLLGRVARLADQVRALREDQQLLRAQLASRSVEVDSSLPSGIAPGASFEGVFQENPQPNGFASDESGLVSEIAYLSPPPAAMATPSYDLPQPLAASAEAEPLAELAKPRSEARSSDASRGWQAPPLVQNERAAKAYRFLTEGNVVAKIGVIVLFFGLAFLLKYAADQAIFPIELRLAAVGLGGAVLLGFGWFLRCRHLGSL